jgi:hypothetical protein
MARVMYVSGPVKGQVVELTAAQITALGSAVRAVIYRDTLGEGTTASNTSA